MNIKAILMIAMLFIPAIVSGKETAKQISVDTIQVLKISGKDERAVIKDTDGKTRVLKPGDSLGTSGKVTEIAANRIVIEQKKGREIEKVIVRLVDGKQKIERLRKTGEQSHTILAPAEKDKRTEKQQNSFN